MLELVHRFYDCEDSFKLKPEVVAFDNMYGFWEKDRAILLFKLFSNVRKDRPISGRLTCAEKRVEGVELRTPSRDYTSERISIANLPSRFYRLAFSSERVVYRSTSYVDRPVTVRAATLIVRRGRERY